MERRLHDIAVDPDSIEPVDVVVLHRVVCCYPDYERLLGAAAAHARRGALVFSYPPAQRGVASGRRGGEPRVPDQRREFRMFAHPPAAMLAVLRGGGLEPAFEHKGGIWQVRGLGGEPASSLTQPSNHGSSITSASSIERRHSRTPACGRG